MKNPPMQERVARDYVHKFYEDVVIARATGLYVDADDYMFHTLPSEAADSVRLTISVTWDLAILDDEMSDE